jgi:hypothetical protein
MLRDPAGPHAAAFAAGVEDAPGKVLVPQRSHLALYTFVLFASVFLVKPVAVLYALMISHAGECRTHRTSLEA